MFELKKAKNLICVFIMFCLLLTQLGVLAECKYCDIGKMYVGEDKYENFNRRMFSLNSKLNKLIARPIHILWSSIMPKYGLDRIQGVYTNIEYPKRLASCLLQKDFKGAKVETQRFITNTTLGLGGMFDPAKRYFKLESTTENMEQALGKCKMKSGHFMVVPILNTCTPRSLLGRLLEAVLDPAVYLASPITSLVKFLFVVNKTSYAQPLAQMIESSYADPYDIAKKLYGMENYIKNTDLDRKDLLNTDAKLVEEEIIANVDNQENLEKTIRMINQIREEESVLNGMDEIISDSSIKIDEQLKADIEFKDYNAQSPVVDAMRTALFDNKEINKSIWNELSIWNKSFARRIKSDSVEITKDRDEYKYRYILQKDKTSPLAILYPSIGEGVNSHHSVVFAKMFYDAGYSVIIQGSHFQWEFAKSMPKGYCPGLPSKDAEQLRSLTAKIIDTIEEKHNHKFSEKILLGTSFGAMATLFVGDKESRNNTLNISKFIAISPPIELVYAINEADKNSEVLNINTEDAKHKTATTAAKVVQILKQKESPDFQFTEMPFSEDEGKLITSVLMRQKLSDLIFTLEDSPTVNKSEIYKSINNISYKNYAEKYLLSDAGTLLEDIAYDTSLYSISDFLKKNDNYKIYHSLDDFFTNKNQLQVIKNYSPNQVICFDRGSHLGFLYREEFLNLLRKEMEGAEKSKK